MGDRLPVIGVVPARAGSKGLPGKNLALLNGRPLYAHAVDAGLGAGLDEVVITTDIPEILEADLPSRVRAVRRPAALAGDETVMAAVLRHLLAEEIPGEAIIVLLQPTSPLRAAAHVRAALERHAEGDASLVFTVVAVDNGVLKSGLLVEGRFQAVRQAGDLFSNRQSLPRLYRPNGAVYVFTASAFRAVDGFPTDAIAAVEMSVADSADIDTPQDLCDCEARLREGGRNP